MTKGRKFVPATSEHGLWFRHLNMPDRIENRSTGTTTGIMLETGSSVDNSSHVKCPPIFQSQIKMLRKRENPFTAHDNKNSFQDHGVYFTQGLGKQKIFGDKCQHSSTDLLTWGRQISPTFSQDRNSLYREDFSYKQIRSQELHRRYSKQYPVPSNGLIGISSNTTLWVTKDEDIPRTYLQTLANTQEPHSKPNPWKYSYHAHSFAVRSKKGRRPLVS
ncbi:testis-expressed protein 36-like [Clavelina lepadiformis]|uniref:testis-expressed protein 36-like n=1 Tax=Clavelina lepadiformis TaxID=159417 RepID=UPI004042D86E